MDEHAPILDPRHDGPSAAPQDTRPHVWRGPIARQPGCLSAQTARQLLDEHTARGDVVLDVDDDIDVAATAAATGRRHHALGGAHHLAAMGHAAGYIDLILLHWPRPTANPQWLLRACRSLLAATGHVAVAVSVDPDQRTAHLTALTGAAATVGLRVVRHVAVLTPDTATPAPTTATSVTAPTGAATPVSAVVTPATVAATDPAGNQTNSPSGEPDTERLRPHTDLLILGIQAADDE